MHRCLIYHHGVPHTLLLEKGLIAQEMKCGSEQLLMNSQVLPFLQWSWSSWSDKTVEWTLEDWESVSLGNNILQGKGNSWWGCISSQSSSIIRHEYSHSQDHKVQGIKTEMVIIKIAINNKCWRGCGERESCCTVGGKVHWYSHNGDSLRN